jgi:outer membrane protein assembly factor BamA
MRPDARALALCAFCTFFGAAARAGAEDEKAAAALEAEEAVPLPATIDAIAVEGLTRTKPYVVRRELGFEAGDVLTQEALDLAVARLWNTTIFAHVKARVVRRDGRVTAVFLIEDRFTLNPLVGYGIGGNAFYFRLGISENNLFGHFLEAQAQYQFFDGFHGGQAIFRNPRTFGQRLETTIDVERLVRPRPGFADQRSLARLEVLALADQDFLRYGARVDAFADRFLPPLDGDAHYPAETNTLLFEPSARIGRVDTVRLRQRGASLELRQGFGATDSPVVSSYTQTSLELLAFVMAGERWNFAVRARLQTISKVPEHLELYVGGLDLLRGYRDNYVRTRGYVLTNLEVRYAAFDSTWIALMPVVFTDAMGSEAAPHALLSVGAGIRVLVPKFVGTGLRFDLAVPLQDPTIAPNLGVYQFF